MLFKDNTERTVLALLPASSSHRPKVHSHKTKLSMFARVIERYFDGTSHEWPCSATASYTPSNVYHKQ